MTPIRVFLLTALAMVAFAGNSLLCRVALTETGIDAASFTAVRLISGAAVLASLVLMRGRWAGGNWLSALALFVYAAGFSFAYLGLSAATGALILFGAVQCTMISYGLARGERLNRAQTLGVSVAVAGLIGLLLPGLSAPPLYEAALMGLAGVAWGVYSLRGRGVADATRETAGNFVRAVPFALALGLFRLGELIPDASGMMLALASGALTSGVGYAIWYQVLPALSASAAATVQLSVPPLAALGGALFLGEPVSLRLGLASLAILGGVAVFILNRRR